MFNATHFGADVDFALEVSSSNRRSGELALTRFFMLRWDAVADGSLNSPPAVALSLTADTTVAKCATYSASDLLHYE